MIVVGIRQHILAFERPLQERRAMLSLKRSVTKHLKTSLSNKTSSKNSSVAISDAETFRFVSFLLSVEGSAAYPDEFQQLMAILGQICTNKSAEMSDFTQWEDDDWRYAVSDHLPSSDISLGVVLVTYRPRDLLPLYMASARRAVGFVHAVVALVTANAYISTLGGGHFLCQHLDRSTLMAKLQIAISMGLHDPILESKCRVNLAYNALQLGRFKRARKILRKEQDVAEQLDSSELRKVCHAANVYLNKLYNLHKEQILLRKTARPPRYQECGNGEER
ncbi:hypothetical protein BBO99_00004880 [Phytophthora kernoviae]|uniref:Uncharacterized protein n=2 Tax=Phytophthora kernoviae TaxID=325452 RepID=A0A3R7J0Z3_9STRA|nr:hypothetical protein G195_005968 [Phytophthora kernoviae 00238/432]KAG2525061.1 hypothetical protein JM16_004707 [Phytophthora kernoviae]KAG2525475.1 hypothetical protein JM18_003549 [Phytophthora kernoviae]RLN02846.1 hypothetical protein BBI17_004962 [Phytophthora kernoviae]RLN79946.1 hypothetical protein BBO99_00004880 [Phytophthora kernoviae]